MSVDDVNDTNGGPPMSGDEWWRSSVVYQLYLKSFADSDRDGLGDLDGVTAHLDHIASLGVDGLWLNPCYPSPQRDGGYDVADYVDIDSRYGGLPAWRRLVDAAHERGLKVLMDLVPNHCSDQHVWFLAALSAAPGSAERARFHFRDGRGPDGSQPPNNWRSTFGGPAWTRVTDGQWYLHSFDSSQPDFDWSNSEVREMFDDVLRTWFDRGADGVRIDVAYAMVKAVGLPDLEDPDGDNPHSWNQPGVHEIFTRWRELADAYGRDLTLVGEVWLPPADVGDYIRPGELNQAFYFDLLLQPFEAGAFRLSVDESLAGLKVAGGVPTWTLNSHDVHRAVTRYGLVEPEPMYSPDANALRSRRRGRVDVALGTARANAAMMFTLALPGSVYLYQGEELGLPEVQDLPDAARQDPIFTRSGGREFGRDGCRVPLPWTERGPSYGFSATTGWLPQPFSFAELAVERQDADPGSTLTLYRRAIAARAQWQAAAELEWIDLGRDDALAFRRGDLTCVTVFDGPPVDPSTEWGQPLLASGDGSESATTTWYRRS